MTTEDVERVLEPIKAFYRRLRREQPPVEGVSMVELQVLTAAARADGSARPGEIARDLHMTSPNVAAALRALERGGLVAREPDRTDGRKILVLVTDRGRRVVEDASSERHAWLRDALDNAITRDERAVLLEAVDVLQRLADYNEAHAVGSK